MAYKAIQKFQEKYHAGRIYNEGDLYPAEGHESTKERIEELSTAKNSYGYPFIATGVEEVEELKEVASKNEEEEKEFPNDEKKGAEIQASETKKGKSAKKSKE